MGTVEPQFDKTCSSISQSRTCEGQTPSNFFLKLNAKQLMTLSQNEAIPPSNKAIGKKKGPHRYRDLLNQ